MIGDRIAVRVGAVTLVLVAVAMVAILGLGNLRWSEVARVQIAFDHVGDLSEGADVQIGARVIGEVESIAPSPDGALVQVAIEERHLERVPRNAEIFVSSKGLLSERFLAIGPPPEGEAPAEPVAAGGPPLSGVAPVLVERLILQSIENTRRFRALLEVVGPEARALAGEIDGLERTLAELEDRPGRFAALGSDASRLWSGAGETRARLAAGGVSAARVEAIALRAERVAGRLEEELAAIERDLDAALADVRRLRGAAAAASLVKLRLAVSRARELSDRVTALAAAARQIAAGVARGEGTVGALLNDPEFINEAKELGKIIKRQPWRLIGTDR